MAFGRERLHRTRRRCQALPFQRVKQSKNEPHFKALKCGFLSLIKKITGRKDKPQDCADDHRQAEIPALRFMAKMLPA